jgi:hypothetical protein
MIKEILETFCPNSWTMKFKYFPNTTVCYHHTNLTGNKKVSWLLALATSIQSHEMAETELKQDF